MAQAEFRRLSAGMSKRQIQREIGPALSIAQDSKTGALSFVHANRKTLPAGLSDQIGARLSGVPDYYPGVLAGSHAEIYAANELLLARPGMTINELRIFTMETEIPKYFLQYKPPCPHCGHLLDGAEILK